MREQLLWERTEKNKAKDTARMAAEEAKRVKCEAVNMVDAARKIAEKAIRQTRDDKPSKNNLKLKLKKKISTLEGLKEDTRSLLTDARLVTSVRTKGRRNPYTYEMEHIRHGNNLCWMLHSSCHQSSLPTWNFQTHDGSNGRGKALGWRAGYTLYVHLAIGSMAPHHPIWVRWN